MKLDKRPTLYLIFCYLLSIGSWLSSVALAQDSPVKAQKFDWVFAYYMSYDNNLSRFAEVILRDLEKGVEHPRVAVVVQADTSDHLGMRRISLINPNGKTLREEITVSSDDSADEVELGKFLEWLKENFPASKYAVTFLNHGGSLNHMCLDEHPSGDAGKYLDKWLRADKTGKVVSKFNRSVEGRVELLFLQQCGRGSLENLYNFAESANYILSSPFVVGAPNTYYTEVLKSVSARTDMNGADLARLIMREDEHYSTYTLASAEALRDLPGHLDRLFVLFDECDFVASQRHHFLDTFSYDGEVNYDVESVFKSLSRQEGEVVNLGVERFLSWYGTTLVVDKSLGPWSSGRHQRSSGLSMFIPSSESDFKRYGDLPLYQEAGMAQFFRRILRSCVTE